jgi:hypothetical protein
MRYYEFMTIWRFDAPLAPVWDCIKHSETWNEWWTGIIRVVELKKGETNGVGAIHRPTWQRVKAKAEWRKRLPRRRENF